jgi:predicted nucleic acid-binding Zn ribbon protein|tara:strand:- start:113 stop:328 length:216 start_codon:yes stop_codon:yes gene_type:complete
VGDVKNMVKQKLLSEQIAKDLAELTAHLNTHEAVCSERFSMVSARLKRLELVIMSSAGAIILLLIGLVFKG